MKIYVSANGPRNGVGSREMPYKTISEAALKARAGDEVIVAPGVYREYVNPVHGGECENSRVVYRSEAPLGAQITGAEVVSEWEALGDNVYKTRVLNGVFGNYNPFAVEVKGDWFFNFGPAVHAGNVYVDGKSIWEAPDFDALKAAEPHRNAWDKVASRQKWFAEVNRDYTDIYVNIGCDPREKFMEISVRRNVFFPDKTGVNYITVSGFKLSHAATQWAPPTAFQDGLIGPHWSKGWIIEDCEIFESKCCGVSLGKCWHPSNNKWTTTKFKDGTQTERDIILYAQHTGWSKDTVGTHIVRRCEIRDCDQTGIVGHLGGVFSLIEDNHIHNINNKKELNGAEIAGIKLHAAIDTIIRRNHIHECTRGIWLDWQAQGTRVSQNLLYSNQPPEIGGGFMNFGEDMFVEVSHGPTLIDNNIMLSNLAFRDASQGLALVHNIIAGPICPMMTGGRYTPYHFPHETDVAGYMTFMHGDDRFYNNIFINRELDPAYSAPPPFAPQPGMPPIKMNVTAGLHIYDEYPLPEEFFARFSEPPKMGFPRFDYFAKMPIYAGGNVYFNGAQPYAKEKDAIVDAEHKVEIDIEFKDGAPYLKTNLYDFIPEALRGLVSTATLGEAFEPEQQFENPDGSPLTVDYDYFGAKRSVNPMPGPIERYNAAPLL